MSESTCPSCGAPATGNFCSRCGAAVATRACPSCGSDATPGDRFCTRCGSPLSGGGAPAGGAGGPRGLGGEGEGDGSLGWWAAGLLLVALMVVALIPILSAERGRTDRSSPAGAAGGADPAMGPAPNVDLSTMTPREAADRLFDRVMRSAEQGDSAQAQNFLPMAIAAYERARPLDADGLFHLSTLQRTAGLAQEALETARRGLEDNPDHLLLLAAAGDAASVAGDRGAAEAHYRHLLEVWPEESERSLEDYQMHEALLPGLREDAQAYLDEGG